MEDEDFGFTKRSDGVLKNVNNDCKDATKNDEGSYLEKEVG